MFFYVNGYYTQNKPLCLKPQYPCVVLAHDMWDDYTYQTTFRMTFYETAAQAIDFGFIKIFSCDEHCTYAKLVKEGKQFEYLKENYCSLGQGIDYYEKLRELPWDYGAQILTALRDISYDKCIRNKFKKFEGVQVSLLRNIGANAALENGAAIFRNELQTMDYLDFTFSTRLPKASNDHKLHVYFNKNSALPIRMNVIIGRNGTGKTSLLGAFAKSLVDTNSQAGKFDSLPLAQCVIAISYSAFDNFEIPSTNESERVNYFYCGLRGNNALLFNAQISNEDIAMLNTESLPEILRAFVSHHLDGTPIVKKETIENTWNISDKYSTLKLKLSNNNTINCYGEKILTFKEQYSKLKYNLDRILSKGSLSINRFTSELLSIIFPHKEQADAFFCDTSRRWGLYNNMSAGQRIISGMIAAVCANIKENSILLIDEPETHLHPGLLSSFMAIVEKILEEFSSYAVIATHSPLILQQVPSSAVTIFERYKNNVSWRKPDFECFGESQQMISEMALDLAEPELDFHDKLNKLLEQDNNIESINTLFNNQLGFAARLYLESLKKQIEER